MITDTLVISAEKLSPLFVRWNSSLVENLFAKKIRTLDWNDW